MPLGIWYSCRVTPFPEFSPEAACSLARTVALVSLGPQLIFVGSTSTHCELEPVLGGVHPSTHLAAALETISPGPLRLILALSASHELSEVPWGSVPFGAK